MSQIKKYLSVFLLIILTLPSVNLASSSVNERDLELNLRLKSIKSRYSFIFPVDHKKCGMINAFADGSQIIVCDEMLALEDLTDDMLLLVLLHEEGHNAHKHISKVANLVKTFNDLKPNQKTSKLMTELVTALRQQHEFEADEYSYSKSSKLHLSEESCEALSKFSEPSDVQEDDSDSTHPSSWKRIHRCKDVLGGN